MEKLQENNPIRFMDLQMEGILQETFHRINERAEKQFFMIFNKLLETYPAPETDDIFVQTQRINQLRNQAEEMIIDEL